MEKHDQTTVWLKVGDQGTVPTYATDGSAGCDLYASDDLVLRPGQTTVLGLDLTMAIEPGIEAQIRPRSGLSLKTAIRLPNSPGTIDSDYRSEVGVILHNTFSPAWLPAMIAADTSLASLLSSDYRRMTLEALLRSEGQKSEADALSANCPDLACQTVYVDQQGHPYGTLYIQRGDRIAQMVFARCLQADFQMTDAPEAIGRDRGGGFGSTGGSSHL